MPLILAPYFVFGANNGSRLYSCLRLTITMRLDSFIHVLLCAAGIADTHMM